MAAVMGLLWQGYRKVFAVYWTVIGVAVGVGFYFSQRLEMPVVANNAASNAIPKIFLGVNALILAVSTLPLFVTYGVTRKRFTRGAALFGAITCAVFAVIATVLAAIDLAVLGSDEPAGKLGALFLTNAMQFLAYSASGWLIGIAYYRFGGWRGTFLLPLTAAPLLIASAAVQRSFDPDLGDYASLGSRGVAVPVALAALAAVAGAAAGWWVTRDVPIRAR